MSWTDVVVVSVTGAGLANCAGFCAAYQLYSGGRWAKDEFGRFMMMFMACMGSLFALVLSSRLWGDWPGRRAVSIALYVVYVLVTLWPSRLLWLAQNDSRKRERTK